MIKRFALALVLLAGMGGCHRDVSGALPGPGNTLHCEQHRVSPDGHIYIYHEPACDPTVEAPPLPPQDAPPMSPDMGVSADMMPPDPCAGVTCPADQVCTNGACACTDTSCAPGSICTNGVCTVQQDMSTGPDMTLVCSDPTPDNCGGICTNLTGDPSNCGTCGNACAPGQTCTSGHCVTPDLCANITCPTTYTCIQGQCVPPSCDYNQNCTFSYGYWKQHWVCNWQQVTLGTVSYDHDQLLTVLNTPSSGSNDLIELAHQLIGAKMNIVKGADASSIQSTVNAADALIGGLVVPSVGTGVLNSATAVSLATTLANYNLGYMGAPHCP